MEQNQTRAHWLLVTVGLAGFLSSGCADMGPGDTTISDNLTEDLLQETSAAISAGTSQCKVTAFKADGCYPAKKWVSFAEGKCITKGLVLAKFAHLGECDNGFSGIEFACCPGVIDTNGGTTSDPTTEPAPNSNIECSVHAAGGPDVCHLAEVWNKKAHLACAEKGLAFGKIKLGGECNGGFSYAKFTCCGNPSPPPPTTSECTEHKVDINACQSEAAWKETLFKMCMEKGQNLEKFNLLAKCSSGGFSGAAFVCCGSEIAPPPPPPPPPSENCVENKFAVNACKSEGELKELAYKECVNLGLSLTSLNVYGPCASGGFSIAAYVCCGDVAPPSPPEEPCFEGTMGGKDSCKPAEVWKEYAAKACAEKNTGLAKFTTAEPCADGTGFHLTYYACCGPFISPQPEPPTEPGPTPTACFEGKMGEPTSCKPSDIWKEYAAKECTSAGANLVKFEVAGPCSNVGGFQMAYYVCCTADGNTDPTIPTDPTQPADCVDDKMGGPTSCKSPDVWKSYATEECTAMGLGLADMQLFEPCENGSYRYAAYKCCGDAATTPPPPPPPTPECYEGKMGGPTSCKSEATWKDYAAKECAIDGYGLAKLGFDDSCGKGEYRYTYYACCIDADVAPPPPPAPTKCFSKGMGDPTSCKASSVWKEYAWQTCETEGFVLTQIALDGNCGLDNYSYVKFTCCAQ